MERHCRYNKVAELVAFICLLLLAGEVAFAMRYHFPWSDDVVMVVTAILNRIAAFVDRHTRMYRIDL
jgi:hypothetical protein